MFTPLSVVHLQDLFGIFVADANCFGGILDFYLFDNDKSDQLLSLLVVSSDVGPLMKRVMLSF